MRVDDTISRYMQCRDRPLISALAEVVGHSMLIQDIEAFSYIVLATVNEAQHDRFVLISLCWLYGRGELPPPPPPHNNFLMLESAGFCMFIRATGHQWHCAGRLHCNVDPAS